MHFYDVQKHCKIQMACKHFGNVCVCVYVCALVRNVSIFLCFSCISHCNLCAYSFIHLESTNLTDDTQSICTRVCLASRKEKQGNAIKKEPIYAYKNTNHSSSSCVYTVVLLVHRCVCEHTQSYSTKSSLKLQMLHCEKYFRDPLSLFPKE